MSSLPPEALPPPRRRTWLWILLGLIGAIIICCCASAVWASTAGQHKVEHWATQVTDYFTEEAGTREAK
jgi:hypothetical protein